MEKISEREMAAILEVSYRTMANLRKAGKIPFAKKRGRYMYDPVATEKAYSDYRPAKVKNPTPRPQYYDILGPDQRLLFDTLRGKFSNGKIRRAIVWLNDRTNGEVVYNFFKRL
jgi:hypothetical protein